MASAGWTLDGVEAGRVVAHADLDVGGTLERDTWTFDVTAGRVALRRRLALGGSASTLVTSNVVCSGYSYALEHDHLARLAARIDHAALGAAAAGPRDEQDPAATR